MRSPPVTPQLQRSAAPAARAPNGVLTTLAPLMEVDFLREAYRHTRKASAPGIDGVTAPQDAAPLDENLHARHERRRRGRSQATPVERVWIAKEDGKPRPIGTPTCEDTMVQRAVAMLLEAMDAQDFYAGSYGFRQGRRPHEALHERRERGRRDTSGWIVEAEGRGDCDSLERTRLREVLRQRVNDGSRLRLIGQWRRAGVMEDAILRHPEPGGVQGGVIAPVLANIVLHHGLEAWCAQEVQPRMQGRGFLMRCADDGVMGGASAADARRIMDVLPQRFAR